MQPLISTFPSSSFPLPILSEEITTTVSPVGTQSQTAPAGAVWVSSPASAWIVTLYSSSPSFSCVTAAPVLCAILVTLATAVSLSTRTSIVSGAVKASNAFFVLITGTGHLSPIAFTVTILLLSFTYSFRYFNLQASVFQYNIFTIGYQTIL